jgi:VWFA-related protein
MQVFGVSSLTAGHGPAPLFRLLMAALLAAGAAVYAQDTQGQDKAPVNTGTVIKTETRLVVVDAVVTDKKDNYVKDLKQKDFKVFEDGKDQPIKTFSYEADPMSPLNNQKHYLVLFFDNSTMDLADQARAREAAGKFIDKNAGPNRLMAIVNFSGSMEMAQNFTDDADRLRQVVQGIKLPSMSSNPNNGGARLPGLAGFGARNMILGVQTLAKGMADVPGRKILVLLTAGLPLTTEVRYDIEAAVSVCNKANVAVYPIDVRGLFTGQPSIMGPGGGRGRGPGGGGGGAALPTPSRVKTALLALADGLRPPIQAAAFTNSFTESEQAGKGGGGTTSGGGTSGGGTTSGGTTSGSAGGGRAGAGSGSTGAGSSGTGTGRTGGVSTSGTGAAGGRGTTGGGGGATAVNPNTGMRMGNPRITPPFPPFAGASQQALYMLADGTGGFVIVNNNDLLAGLEKIGAEQNQFYIIGYSPNESAEGSCHTLNVKVEHGYKVRSRSGYCNVKSADLLSGKPTELQLETRIQGTEPGDLVAPGPQVTYFFTGPDTARVDLAMDLPSDKLKFEKVKGKLHSDINILGLAYKADGTIGARFSDTLKLEAEDKKEAEKVAERPLHYQAQFDAASGDYTFKIAFTANGGADFGKLQVPLDIEPFDGKELRMSSVLLSTNVHRIGPEDLSIEADLIDGRTPFIAVSGPNSFQLTPTGKLSFKKTDSVACYLEAFEPLIATTDQVQLGVQIRILDKTGEAKLDSGMQPASNFIRKGNPTVPIALKVPVDKLDAGTYKLEVSVVDSAGKSVKKTTSLTIE